MSQQSPLPQNDPVLIAFQKLKKTPEYQNETFVCQCECHSGNMERACVGFEVEGLNIAPWNAEK
jgi:hypothetical protein